MTWDKLIEYFGTVQKAADSLQVTRQTIYDWREGIPELRQLEIQRQTGGLLKADADVVRKFRELVNVA